MRVTTWICLLVLTTTNLTAQTPEPPLSDLDLSIHTLVREDIFAGWRANDMERFARGEKNIDLLLEQRPSAKADLLAWKGAANIYRAVLAHEADDAQAFGEYYQKTVELFEEARRFGPNSVGVAAVSGGSYVYFGDRLPKDKQEDAWKAAYQSYQVLWKMQSESIEHLPVHIKGELLAGLAQSAQRTGRSDELNEYLDRMIEVLPKTRYEKIAKKWKADPSSAARGNISCKSCHAQDDFGQHWPTRTASRNKTTPRRIVELALWFGVGVTLVLRQLVLEVRSGETMNIAGKLLMIATLVLGWMALTSCDAQGQEFEHGFASSGDVQLHYVTAGDGPLLIMIHGFPDYWYTWRKQIPELAKRFKVVAIDQRGYNKSDKPDGVENYTLAILAQDIQNLVKHFGHEKTILVGHDWGGYVAWTCAMRYPDMVDRLVILNAPHPNGLRRELSNNEEQRKNSQYARNFQAPDAASKLTANGLAGWVTDPRAKSKYVEAFQRSSFEAMLNYYKANYPTAQTTPSENATETATASSASLPTIQCPVLMIHGLKDKALMPDALNDSWKWMDKELTIITVPGADHFVQQDAAELVTERINNWLR